MDFAGTSVCYSLTQFSSKNLCGEQKHWDFPTISVYWWFNPFPFCFFPSSDTLSQSVFPCLFHQYLFSVWFTANKVLFEEKPSITCPASHCVAYLYHLLLPLCYDYCPVTEYSRATFVMSLLALPQDKLLLLAVLALLVLTLLISYFGVIKLQRDSQKL